VLVAEADVDVLVAEVEVLVVVVLVVVVFLVVVVLVVVVAARTCKLKEDMITREARDLRRTIVDQMLNSDYCRKAAYLCYFRMSGLEMTMYGRGAVKDR
jgi:hypothetical protein